MSLERWPNLAAMFYDQVDRLGDRPFLWAKRESGYRPLSWGDTAARVTPLARGLLAQGVKPGDRVVLVSENRPAWLVGDLAIMSIGAITVPAYVTNTVEDHRHILADSGAKGVIVSQRRLADRVIAAARSVPTASFVAAMDPPPGSEAVGGHPKVIHLDKVIEQGRARHENIIEMSWRWQRKDTACIIYTSGTGGVPKGVMQSHGSILHNCAGALDALLELGLNDEVFLSFLPLSHSYEHTAGQFFPIAIGAEIYYAEGVETLGANMLDARPTIMTAVPRLYETLHNRIRRGIEKAGGLKQALFEAAVRLGRKRHEAPESMSLIERLQDRVLDKLVRAKVAERFGGRLKALVSGGAPLNPEIGLFFTALGVRILQGYGQTESAPVISVNRPSRPRMHTVGPPVLNTEVRIASDGEILVRGELVMQGYWNNPQATADAIKDGWLHTGDIGHFDADGSLVITDRKKDIIVLSGGDNVAPQRVEGALSLEKEIAQAMVVGDKRPHLVALLVPDADWMASWAAEHGKAPHLTILKDDGDFLKTLGAVLDRVNGRLSSLEKVRRFMLADGPFTIDNGQMTPTMKVRRHKLREAYGARLEALYR